MFISKVAFMCIGYRLRPHSSHQPPLSLSAHFSRTSTRAGASDHQDVICHLGRSATHFYIKPSRLGWMWISFMPTSEIHRSNCQTCRIPQFELINFFIGSNYAFWHFLNSIFFPFLGLKLSSLPSPLHHLRLPFLACHSHSKTDISSRFLVHY